MAERNFISRRTVLGGLATVLTHEQFRVGQAQAQPCQETNPCAKRPVFERQEPYLAGGVEWSTLTTPAACSFVIANPQLLGDLSLKRFNEVIMYPLPFIVYPGIPRLAMPEPVSLEPGVALSTADIVGRDPQAGTLYIGGGRYGDFDVPVPVVHVAITKPNELPIEMDYSTAVIGARLYVHTQIYDRTSGIPLDRANLEFVNPIHNRVLAAIVRSRDREVSFIHSLGDPDVLSTASRESGPAIQIKAPQISVPPTNYSL